MTSKGRPGCWRPKTRPPSWTRIEADCGENAARKTARGRGKERLGGRAALAAVAGRLPPSSWAEAAAVPAVGPAAAWQPSASSIWSGGSGTRSWSGANKGCFKILWMENLVFRLYQNISFQLFFTAFSPRVVFDLHSRACFICLCCLIVLCSLSFMNSKLREAVTDWIWIGPVKLIKNTPSPTKTWVDQHFFSPHMKTVSPRAQASLSSSFVGYVC